jgi:membrane protein DedA with SNARE-associated domain
MPGKVACIMDSSLQSTPNQQPEHANGTALDGRQPPTWLGPILVAIVAGLWIMGFATSSLAPKLLKDHPLGLMALNPRYRYMVIGAPRIDALPFYLVGILRLLASDPVYFLLGWVYGEKALGFFEDALGKQTMDSTRKFFLKAGTVMALFFAGPIICVFAGAARMNPKKYFTLDIIGTCIIVFALRQFSDAMSGFINGLLRFNDRNAKWLMVITIVTTLIVVANVGSKRVGALKNFTRRK